MDLYWLAIAQLLYERCLPGVFGWHELDLESKAAWVWIARQAQQLFERSDQ